MCTENWVTDAGYNALIVEITNKHRQGYIGLPPSHCLYQQPLQVILSQVPSPFNRAGACVNFAGWKHDIPFQEFAKPSCYGAGYQCWWIGFNCPTLPEAKHFRGLLDGCESLSECLNNPRQYNPDGH